jgi:tetratricopeptide (TPR) repeat protein
MKVLTVLACLMAVMLVSCKTTTVSVKPIRETEMKEGPTRIVDSKELEEEGVTSKPVETNEPLPGNGEGEDSGVTKKAPSPTKVIPPHDKKKASELLEKMKSEAESEKTERSKKFDEMVKKIRGASSKDITEEAKKKFDEAEKLYSEKKLEEAEEAYKKVIELVPTHREAQERLRQCRLDIEEKIKARTTEKKAAPREQVLLLEQKFAAAVCLYEEGEKDDALKKFKEVVEMIEWSRTRIDEKEILPKAREYVERIKIEKELAGKAQKKEAPEEKKPAEKEEKAPEKPKEPEKKEPEKKKEEPKPGDAAAH